MEKIINRIRRIFKKRYFLITFVFSCFLALLGLTYSYWATESGFLKASEIRFKNLSYLLNINENGTSIPGNTVQVSGFSEAYYDIQITSLNEINTRYILTYLLEGSTELERIDVRVSSLSNNDSSGIIGLYESGSGGTKTKNIRIIVTNNSVDYISITFKIQGGYTWNNEDNIKIEDGYNKITNTKLEKRVHSGLTFAEQINEILDCTPTANVPCLYKENANNYLQYSGYTWRILGTYLINDNFYTKLILNEPLETSATYSGVSTRITNFYNSLSDNSLIARGPFNCTGTSSITCTGNDYIGLISKSEYDLVEEVNSYLYTKPNEQYWLNTAVSANSQYVATSRGIGQLSTSQTAYIRPSIYLDFDVVSPSSTSYYSVENLVTNGGFEQGIVYWTPSYTGKAISNSALGLTDSGYRVFSFNSPYSRNVQKNLTLEQNHKYYLSTMVYQNYTSTANKVTIELGTSTINVPKSTSWQKASIIYENNQIQNLLKITKATGTVNNNNVLLDNILLVDLTETFGSGYEPTKEWCDSNLNYFDTTKNMSIRSSDLGTQTNPFNVIQGYKLTLNMNSGTSSLRDGGYYATGSTNTIHSLYRNFYNFSGWTVSGQSSSATQSNFTMGTSDTTLTAGWEPISYDISYVLNGGTNFSSNPSTYTIEEDGITLGEPTRSCYNFAGWTGSNGSTPQTSVIIPAGSTGNLNYTATWTPELSSISVKTLPTAELVFPEGTTVSNNVLSGLVIEAMYCGGTKKDISYRNGNISIALPTTQYSWTDKNITISYTENGTTRTTTIPIEVTRTATIFTSDRSINPYSTYAACANNLGSNTLLVGNRNSVFYNEKYGRWISVAKFNFSNYAGFTVKDAKLNLQNLDIVDNDDDITTNSQHIVALRNSSLYGLNENPDFYNNASLSLRYWYDRQLVTSYDPNAVTELSVIQEGNEGVVACDRISNNVCYVDATQVVQELVDIADAEQYGMTIAGIEADMSNVLSTYSIGSVKLTITYSNRERPILTRIPDAGLTNNNYIKASSIYSSSYTSYKAFDYINKNSSWATSNSQTSAYIAFDLGQGQVNQYSNLMIDITNRLNTNPEIINGPIDYEIYLSNDINDWSNPGQSWGTSAGSRSTCPGSNSHHNEILTNGCSIRLDNTTPYRYVKIVFTDWYNLPNYLAVGEIRIWGHLETE